MLLVGIVEAVEDHHLIFAQKAKTEIAIGSVVVGRLDLETLAALQYERWVELKDRRMLPVVGDVDQLAIARAARDLDPKLEHMFMRMRHQLHDIAPLAEAVFLGQSRDFSRRQSNVHVTQPKNLRLMHHIGRIGDRKVMNDESKVCIRRIICSSVCVSINSKY